MEVCIGRQPIFDRAMNVYGYELFYQRSGNDFFEASDDSQATAELINSAYLSMQFHQLTNGTRAFIYFSKDLIEKEIPLLLPGDKIVVEITGRGLPTTAYMNACRRLKKEGYKLAIDNFIPHESYLPLIDLVDIIKVDFDSLPHDKQLEMIKKYRNKFLAKKIDTRESYQEALSIGYTLFEGCFFRKPDIITTNEIEILNTNLIRIMNILNEKDLDYQEIADIIEGDLGLTFKLLKVSNLMLFGSTHKIGSIKQALVRLGTDGISKWVYVLMLKEVQQVNNREIIKSSLIRAKWMELIAVELGIKARTLDFFITGMFSSIDILLNSKMGAIIRDLPFTMDVKKALLGEDNSIRQALDTVLAYEMVKWDKIDDHGLFKRISKERFMMIYMEALKWTMELE